MDTPALPQVSQATIEARVRAIQAKVLEDAKFIRKKNFEGLHTDDLQMMLRLYDAAFFQGLLGKALGTTPLYFRLSRRLTAWGGLTTRETTPAGHVDYFEIAISTPLLLDSFREGDREVTVCGVRCESRLDALQRVFEHELVHLFEYLTWGDSMCGEERFEALARNLFGHTTHTHAMVTKRERAAAAGIRPSAAVSFDFQGRRLTGFVARVTKRATVLVEDPSGTPYSNGLRYRKYFVPLSSLRVI